MHLRVISPAADTADLLALLDGTPGVADIVVHEGAARSPRGDVVICDVARESADELVGELKRRGLADRGSVALDEIGVELSRRAERAERLAPGDGSDAVIWEQLEQRTGEESRLSVTLLAFFVVAMLIGGIGVLTDSPILIVGAMVVGPEFGPLAALSVGIVRRRGPVVGRAVLALAAGFALGGGATVLGTWGLDALGLIDRGMLLADRPFTAFIYRPDALSWVVAFLAGVAGILSLTSAKSGALIGVLISVTTVPAAANAAVALAFGVGDEALGSALQLGVNLSAIVIAGVATLLVQRGWRALRRRTARTAP
jgi:uncharacterized hydrophobic protein (TIGR00271 family)